MTPILWFALTAAVLYAATRPTVIRVQTFDDTETDPEMGLNADSGYWPGVYDLAHAIANAEGFGIPNAIPTRAHNPGDLVLPGWAGGKLGTEGISIFADDTDGWARLTHQLQLICDGRSHVYRLSMTIRQFGQKWTATEQEAWTANVCAWLNDHGYAVDPTSTLGDVLTL